MKLKSFEEFQIESGIMNESESTFYDELKKQIGLKDSMINKMYSKDGYSCIEISNDSLSTSDLKKILNARVRFIQVKSGGFKLMF